jgi:hypothetical protein
MENKMIRFNNVDYAKRLVESISYALDNIENNTKEYGSEVASKTEAGYLAEKIGKLYDLHFDKNHKGGSK